MKVWQKSHELTLLIYQATVNFPKEELYGLTSQMRRAAYSIPTNIAEGSGRSSNTEFKRFLQIAMGSAAELEYQLLLAKDLSYLSINQYEPLSLLIVEIRKMLGGFIKYLASQEF
jgi:four helix bundle protein